MYTNLILVAVMMLTVPAVITFCSVRFTRGVLRYLLLAVFVLVPALLAIYCWVDYHRLMAIALSDGPGAADASFNSETQGFLFTLLIPFTIAAAIGAGAGILALVLRKR